MRIVFTDYITLDLFYKRDGFMTNKRNAAVYGLFSTEGIWLEVLRESVVRCKDRVLTELVSNAVYLYKCGQCSTQYIGETSCHIITRVCHHKGISRRPGRPLTKPNNSRILEHWNFGNHGISLSDFKILKTCKTRYLKVTESVCIKKIQTWSQ